MILSEFQDCDLKIGLVDLNEICKISTAWTFFELWAERMGESRSRDGDDRTGRSCKR